MLFYFSFFDFLTVTPLTYGFNLTNFTRMVYGKIYVVNIIMVKKKVV